MEERYRMLRKLQPVLRIAAWVVGAFYVIVAIVNFYLSLTTSWPEYMTVRMQGAYGVLGYLSTIVIAGVWWLGLTVAAELVGAVVDIAENTSATADLLEEPEQEEPAAE